jgi:hypothetical protein
MSPERVGYANPERGFVRVKTGFSWPAFFFGGMWAVAKGLWLVALAMFALDALIWFGSGYAAARHNDGLAALGLVFQIAYWVVRGRRANAWWRAKLIKQGYRPAGTNRAT